MHRLGQCLFATLTAAIIVGCKTSDLQTATPVPVMPVAPDDMRTEQILQLWLLEDCSLPADDRLIAVVRQRRQEVIPLLRSALDLGPPTELVTAVEHQARTRWQQSRKLLEDPAALGLADTELARARQQTVEQYVARARQELDAGYRSQALLGLADLLGEQANSLIDRIAEDQQSPAHATARVLRARR